MKKKISLFNIIITGIPLTIYLVFMLIPSLAGFVVSLTNWSGYNLNFNFVGFSNFQKMFVDTRFFNSLWNYLYLYIGTVLVCFPLAMLFAIAISRNMFREKNFYRILFFFPSTVPMLIIAIMWMVIYNPSFGVLNDLIGVLGIEPVAWLGNAKTVMPSIIAIVVWRQLGFYFVYFTAGVLNIPKDLYESAKIDGANEIRQTFYITIPLMWNVIRTSMIFYIQSAAGLGFGITYMATRGGPNYRSEILTYYMYNVMQTDRKFGYASTLGCALLVVTVTIALIILRFSKRETYEY
jgi:N-acetylglucosamine transport system permease protein